jgi:hypothetical protein
MVTKGIARTAFHLQLLWQVLRQIAHLATGNSTSSPGGGGGGGPPGDSSVNSTVAVGRV